MKPGRLSKLTRTATLAAALLCATAGTAAAATLGPSHSKSYWVVTKAGKVCSAGKAKTYGNGHGSIKGITGTSNGAGYWIVLKSGKVEAFGDAKHDKYHKAALTKWHTKLGACKTNVVGAAVAHVKAATKSKPKPPTTTTTTPTTSTPSSSTSTTPSGAATTPTSTDTAPASTTSTPTPPPVTTTTTTTTTPPVTTTTTTTPPAVPSITTSSIPEAEASAPYSTTFAAAGVPGGTYTWSLDRGQTPAGLTLQPDGTLSGTPTQTGSYSLDVLVTASDGYTEDQTFPLTVIAAVNASSVSFPASEAGISFSSALTATSGRPPYTWSLTGESLPSGLQLSNAGALTGAPTTAGNYSFTATVTDALGGTSSQTYGLTVDAPPSITTSELPDPVQTLAYDQQLATSGGAGGMTWSITSGALPAGLSLSSGGEITGTPTTPSAYDVTVQATDSLGGTATESYSGLTADWDGDENWSGYNVTGANPYTSVSGTFNVPDLDHFEATSGTPVWVGIDGAHNSTLLQVGITADDTMSGTPVYAAFTEMVPQQETEQKIAGFTINPGDSVTASLDETDVATQTWSLSIVDNTTGQTYSTSEVYTGVAATAEWIAEAPTDAEGHLVSMAPWTGNINFTDLSTSEPTTGLEYMTLSPGFVSGGAMNSLFDSAGFAIGDEEEVPPPLAVSG